MNKKLNEKISESLSCVLPVTCIVLLLCITITPMPLDPLMLFLAGAAFLIVGMGFFTLGADMAMMPIGERVGAKLTSSGRLPLIALACFITVSYTHLDVYKRQQEKQHAEHRKYQHRDDPCHLKAGVLPGV